MGLLVPHQELARGMNPPPNIFPLVCCEMRAEGVHQGLDSGQGNQGWHVPMQRWEKGAHCEYPRSWLPRSALAWRVGRALCD